MIERTCITILVGLALVAGCDRRAVSTNDGSATRIDFAAQHEARSALEVSVIGEISVPPATCKQLSLVGKTVLGLPPNAIVEADNPALAFDDKGQFGVVWLSQAQSSPTAPTLSFARVGLNGTATTPFGTVVGLANQGLKGVAPELRHQGAEYAALYVAASGATALVRFDEQGKLLTLVQSIGGPTQFSLEPHLGGYAVLYVNPLITELRFAIFPWGGGATDKLLHTGEGYWAPWLGPRPGGWAATWGKRFARLDSNGSLLEQPATVLSTDMLSSSYVVLPGGYAAAYARSKDFFVELQRLDAAGKPVGAPRPIGPSNIGQAPLRQIGLVWTGASFIVTYPSTSPSSEVMAQLLDSEGALVGKPLLLPHCLISSRPTGAAAWGGGRVAVATVDGLSGLPSTGICITLLECR